MNGVKFGDKHSIKDWDLLMTSRDIEDAQPDENYIKIPGFDGEKDLTEAFGEVRYLPRKISISFDIFKMPNEWVALKDEITNYLNGRKMKIIFDTDPNYYYYGRCKVVDFYTTYTVAHITIEATCEPYKYKINPTSITRSVSVGNTYTYKNDRKTVVPTFTLDSAMTFRFNGTSYSLNAGTHKVLNIEFVEGDNNITIITGSGTLQVVYQEGRL